TVVLDRDAPLGVGEVDAADPQAAVVDVVLAHGHRQAVCEDATHEAHLGDAARDGAWRPCVEDSPHERSAAAGGTSPFHRRPNVIRRCLAVDGGAVHRVDELFLGQPGGEVDECARETGCRYPTDPRPIAAVEMTRLMDHRERIAVTAPTFD